MSKTGSGPVFTLILVGATVGAHYLWFPFFSISGASDDLLLSIGIGLCALGVYVFALTGTRMIRDRLGGGTVRRRPAFVFRYPLNGAIVLFIVPGLGFLLGSWLPFVCAPVLFVLYRRLGRQSVGERRVIGSDAELEYR